MAKLNNMENNGTALLLAKLYKKIVKYHLAKNSNLRYVGLSIYKKEKKEKEVVTVHGSSSLYINLNQSYKISHNDFGGYVFPKLYGNEKGEGPSGKDFNYLKLFFKDIDYLDEPYDKFFCFKIKKNLMLQLVFLYKNKPDDNTEEQIVDIVRHYLKDKKDKKTLEYNKILLSSTKIINNASIIIIDLIRDQERYNSSDIQYAEASISRKLIFDIADIISSYGFYICGHTGDGFFFLSNEKERKILLKGKIYALLCELEAYMDKMTKFLKPLNHGLLHHRLRILVDKIETVFEMNDGAKMMSKLYFSSDLDKAFCHMSRTAKHHGKHLLLKGSCYKKIEWVSPDWEVIPIQESHNEQ